MTSLRGKERRFMARMATVAVASGGIFVFACSEANFRTLGYGIADDAGSPPPLVGSTDAAEPDARAELTQYCPSNKCPEGRTTCPTSPFACDIDLRSDLRNCGACGLVCATTLSSFRLTFDCIEGQCVKQCQSSILGTYADCNGVLDDGCEVKLGSNDNCNGCGDRCTDPKKPCIFDSAAGKGQCGCDPGLEYCGRCIDPKIDDTNCGGCGITCDPSGDGGAPRDHAYYGCAGSTCGHLKCEQNYADCDGDATNGCETYLLAPDHCGACGTVCNPGQTCIVAYPYDNIECACPPGKTLCGNECVDLLSDPRHCGACTIDCLFNAPTETGIASCSFGSCDYACAVGRGDCNGDAKDGCETNLGSDPRNCGACGHTCDLAAGQPCVLGSCVVEACDGGVITQ